MIEKSYEQVLEEFNVVDKINNPSHYKGKFGLEDLKKSSQKSGLANRGVGKWIMKNH